MRKWVLLDERLSAAAVEAIELKLDVAEANLHEALGSEDPRRRDAVSMFFLRHMQRAAKRGYAVAALGVEANAEPARPVRYTIRWANEPVDDRAEPDDGDDTVVRDGKRLIMPKYGARETDSIDGAVVEPSVLLEHAVDIGVVESPVAVEPTVVEPEREPESAAVRYERERIDAWIWNRLIRSPPVSVVVSRSLRVLRGRRFRTAIQRRGRGFIALVTMSGGRSRKRRRGRRWGSRAEAFRSERLQCMRGAGVARVARSHATAAVGRASVRTICAAAGSCAGTPSTMITAGKLIEHGTSPEPSIKPATTRISVVRRSVGGAGRINRRAGPALARKRTFVADTMRDGNAQGTGIR